MTGLDDIVVTAQRRSESAQKAAIAISVVTPESLVAVTQPSQLTSIVPALQVGSAGGSAPLIYVRGVGSFSANAYTDSAVSVNYDGVYLARPTSTSGLFYDLERLEVLKGPQGTLYGRNATAGALNVIPAKPRLGEYSGNGTISFGNYGSVNGQAAVNIPVSEAVALRLAGTGYTHDGYLSDGTYSEEGQGGRAQLLFQPSDKMSIRVGADYFHLGGTGAASVLLGFRNPVTGALTPSGFGPDTGSYDPLSTAALTSAAAFVGSTGAVFGGLANRPNADNEYYGFNAEITADLGFAQLTVIPAYRKSMLDESAMATSFVTHSDEEDEQFSLEARLAGTVGPVDWLAGAFYFDDSVQSLYNINANIQGGTQTIDAQNKSWAAFGRATYRASDRLRLTAAIRFTQDDKDFTGSSVGVVAVCTSPTHLCPNVRRLPAGFTDVRAALASIGYIQPPGASVFVDVAGASGIIWSPTVIDVDDSISPSKTTFRAGVEYDAGPQSMLYGSVETGYRSGGFSFSSVNPVYQPETITAYTLGSKNRFFDNRLQLNVEAFYWKYKDQQIAHFTTGLGGALEFATENIGSSTNKGVELEVVARPLENTVLRADIQYLDATYDDFIYLDPDTSSFAGLPPGTAQPITACPSTYRSAANAFAVDCSGTRAQRSPEWTFNLGAEQTVPINAGFDLVFAADTHYQSSSIVMFERLPFGVQESYFMSNASVTLENVDHGWSVSAYVDNIENDRPTGSAFLFTLNNAVSNTTSPPRTYGIRLRANF